MALSKTSAGKQFTDDDLITCGICHIEIERPRSLLCLHTYCLGCLREWSKKNKKDVVICPICRETTPLPANGVDGLRSNFFVTKLKDRKVVSRQLMEKDVKIMCTSCDVVSDMNEAVARCVECDDFVCDKCVKVHKTLRSSRNHTILSLDELRTGKANLTLHQSKDECCVEHNGQVLWFFCQTCGVPTCRDCTVVDHPASSHALVKLTVATVGQREEIKRLASTCEKRHRTIITSQEEIQAIGEELEVVSSLAKTSIHEAGQNVIKAVTKKIQQQCNDKISQVSLMKSAKEKKLSEDADKLEVLQSRFNSALEMAKQVTDNGSDCDVASVYSALTTTLKQLQNVQPSLASKNMTKLVFVDTSSKVGLTGTIGNVVGVAYSRENKVRLGSTWRLCRKFGETGNGKLKDAKGIASIGDSEIAVADYDAARVYIYSVTNGDLTRSIDTTKSLHSNPSSFQSHPYNVVEHCDGSVIVTDYTYFPTIYDSEGNYIRQLDPGHKVNTIGIAISSENQVLIGSYSSKGIDIVDYADDKHKSAINVDMIYPCNIALSKSSGRIIITANNTSGAQVIDDKGNTLHKLCPPRESTAEWCPTGLCTIGEGGDEEVLICNLLGTPGVYRFSVTTGKYLGCVTTELRNPHGITLIGDELFVADETCVKVFTSVD